MSVVFSVSPLRPVQDVHVKSKNGRSFVVDIYSRPGGDYEATVTVLDPVSKEAGSWLYDVTPQTTSARDNFSEALNLVQNYLRAVDPADSISDIHNPCNCAFVSESDQNDALGNFGMTMRVRVN